ncbi:MAG: Gfo/Idh/MocA family oxidoreductase, partial [Candidatus Limnocylindrales bacterium]
GCHCIEIIRNFVGKGDRPVEILCHTDTLVHPIADEDNAVAFIRFESGAIGQFEVSWTFRGGMDLRDEVAGTHGTVWMNHFLRTGIEMFTAGPEGGYVAEKAETSAGWLFPVGDEVSELGYVDMFSDMFRAIDAGLAPQETFYDGYVVNAVMDAAYRSARAHAWEPIALDWRAGTTARIASTPETFDGQIVIKREILPDGRHKLILKDPVSGDFTDRVVGGG